MTPPSLKVDEVPESAVEAARGIERCGANTTWPENDAWPCSRPTRHDGPHGPYSADEWMRTWIAAACPHLPVSTSVEGGPV